MTRPTILHYTGYDDDRGGVMSVVRALDSAGRFGCVLGVNPGFRQHRAPPLATLELPAIAAERLGVGTLWRARAVARAAGAWLRAGPGRIFHGHSRAGLAVALWLHAGGERRVLASVRCLGRRRWFYRGAARLLGPRLLWLGPAMKRHYGVGGSEGYDASCVPDCVPLSAWRDGEMRSAEGGVRNGSRSARSAGGAEICFGCAGGLVPVKQWELVLRALALVPAAARVRVAHAGGEDGSAASAAYAARLRRLAEEMGVAARVDWRGEQRDMGEFYAGIDCLVVASRWEASSMAALEAAAAGVPVLAADAAGTRDLVAAARIGWLFAADSAESLAARMTELATGDELQGWRRDDGALRAFTAPVVAARLEKIYAGLLSP